MLAEVVRFLKKSETASVKLHCRRVQGSVSRESETVVLHPRARPQPHQPYTNANPLAIYTVPFGANPFPEVTDLVCRLPLPTLFCRPEAFSLGDLLRLTVRPDVGETEKTAINYFIIHSNSRNGEMTQQYACYKTKQGIFFF